jgi:hypothetical protein
VLRARTLLLIFSRTQDEEAVRLNADRGGSVEVSEVLQGWRSQCLNNRFRARDPGDPLLPIPQEHAPTSTIFITFFRTGALRHAMPTPISAQSQQAAKSTIRLPEKLLSINW